MSKGIAGKITGHCFYYCWQGSYLEVLSEALQRECHFKLAELWADIWICKSNRAGSWNPGHYIRTQYQDYDRKHYWCINRNYYLSVL